MMYRCMVFPDDCECVCIVLRSKSESIYSRHLFVRNRIIRPYFGRTLAKRKGHTANNFVFSGQPRKTHCVNVGRSTKKCYTPPPLPVVQAPIPTLQPRDGPSGHSCDSTSGDMPDTLTAAHRAQTRSRHRPAWTGGMREA